MWEINKNEHRMHVVWINPSLELVQIMDSFEQWRKFYYLIKELTERWIIIGYQEQNCNHINTILSSYFPVTVDGWLTQEKLNEPIKQCLIFDGIFKMYHKRARNCKHSFNEILVCQVMTLYFRTFNDYLLVNIIKHSYLNEQFSSY